MSSPANLRIVVLQHEPETGLGAFDAVFDLEPETGLGAFDAVFDQAHVDYEIVETLRGPLPDFGAFDGAIALGGSLSVYDPRLLATRRWIRNGVLRGLPFLGVCLGGQLGERPWRGR